MQLITSFFFTENFLSRVRFSLFAREKRNETFRTRRRRRRYRWARCENKTRFLLSYRARHAHTHTNLEKGEFFFLFFACFLLITKVNFTETLYTAALFFSFGHSPKSHSISLFYFFPPRSLCLFFCRQKTHARPHEREKRVAVK